MEGFDDDQKVSEMLTYIVAGHDTTGFSLSTALVLLAQRPQVAQKVYDGIRTRDFHRCTFFKMHFLL